MFSDCQEQDSSQLIDGKLLGERKLISNYVSPSQNMQSAIAAAINSRFQMVIEPQQIAINICYPKYATHYTSAIALAISKQLSLEPLQIAEAIAQSISQNPEIASQYQLATHGKGWLNISLREECILSNLRALEDWQLDGIAFCEGFWQKRNPIKIQDIKVSEAMQQYVYARCCALFRLAYKENLISIQYPFKNINISTIALCKWRESLEMSLFFQHIAIAEFLSSEFLDSAIRAKLARSLTAIFMRFYDCCRIFGVSREIALSRLVLISITQKLLLAIAPPHVNYTMYL